jgi:predicted acyltransferase
MDHAAHKQLPVRLHSIDVFRAVTMFLMIFVNDVAGVKNIPKWIEHVSADADGLGFADTIFPAFLFIVGLSIPFAIRNRLKKGYNVSRVAAYIAVRAVALLVMGFLHVNLENYNSAALLPKAVWEIIITIAFFLIWLDYPDTMQKSKRYLLQGIAVVLLIMMAAIFKGGTPQQPVGFQTYWWGILGLIGWSYLICAFIFLLSGGTLTAQVIALLFFLAFNVAFNAGLLSALRSVSNYIWIVGDASMPALTMAGVVVSVLYTNLIKQGKERLFWTLLLSIGVAFILFGFATRPLGGISKIRATPSWVGICNGISSLFFGLFIYLVDLKGRKEWFRLIRPAGTSTLTCYLIPYILYSVYRLIHFNFPAFLSEGIGGIIRSFATAFVVILIAGVLEKRRVRLSI